jgi:hypothetical protein
VSFVSFAVCLPVDVTVSASGAGSAAYRFGRLVNVPEYNMLFHVLPLLARRALYALAIGILLWPAAVLAGPGPETIMVSVDQAKLVRLPTGVATIVVGNPLIADVTLQTGGVVVVTGKGYGATNFIAMDRSGAILVDRLIQVEGPTEELVTVYRGVERETYSCVPICQRRMTLGDADRYFSAVASQAGALNTQAAASASPPNKN